VNAICPAGACARASIAWSLATREVRSSRLDLLDGFEPKLLKFDGVTMTEEQESSSLQSILW
jgi:hypothetical protein